jgi:hypothetical protein
LKVNFKQKNFQHYQTNYYGLFEIIFKRLFIF